MQRVYVFILAFFVSLTALACGGGGGPTEPSIPSVAGVYNGTNAIVTNTCTGETGVFADIRSVAIAQTGSSIRITLAGLTLNGSIDSGGGFTASGSTVIDGVQIQSTMNGSITGGRFVATEQATLSIPGESCTLVLSFNMTRES
jgi:hypothetical protein